MRKIALVLALGASLFAADGKAIYDANCAACHGADGKDSAVSGKVIAGQSQADLDKKLTGYKAGTFGGANKASMQAAIAGVSDADLKSVAAYLSTVK